MSSPKPTTGRPKFQLINGLKMPLFFSTEAIKSALNHKVQDEDIVLCTYPKCGTNWTQQIVTLLRNQGQPVTGALNIIYACPFLEMYGADALELSRQKPPRFYKVHFDYRTVDVNPKAKYIAVVRNPKDCLISMYHFLNTDAHSHQSGQLESFFASYITGDCSYGSYFDFILSWYEHRNDANVLFLYYEEMKRDIRSNIRRIAAFLGSDCVKLLEDEQTMEDIVRYSGVEYMRNHFSDKLDDLYRELGFAGADLDSMEIPSGLKYSLKSLSGKPMTDGCKIGLVRKGVVGDGKVSLTAEMNAIMDELIEKRLVGTEMYDYWKEIDCL